MPCNCFLVLVRSLTLSARVLQIGVAVTAIQSHVGAPVNVTEKVDHRKNILDLLASVTRMTAIMKIIPA